ncbi:MAG: hypothetical protein F4Z96_06780 [Chloroflexi bacterium]|nr:hypothetical protein [Chloroflexota bacterium]MYD98677.1 hypothetical protein [Gammaproteobacteria bacterium]
MLHRLALDGGESAIDAARYDIDPEVGTVAVRPVVPQPDLVEAVDEAVVGAQQRGGEALEGLTAGLRVGVILGKALVDVLERGWQESASLAVVQRTGSS